MSLHNQYMNQTLKSHSQSVHCITRALKISCGKSNSHRNTLQRLQSKRNTSVSAHHKDLTQLFCALRHTAILSRQSGPHFTGRTTTVPEKLTSLLHNQIRASTSWLYMNCTSRGAYMSLWSNGRMTIIRGNVKLREQSIPVLFYPLRISHNKLTRD
jgi:hypothetical protein